MKTSPAREYQSRWRRVCVRALCTVESANVCAAFVTSCLHNPACAGVVAFSLQACTPG